MKLENCKILGATGPLILLIGGILEWVINFFFNINFIISIPTIVGALFILVSLYHLANFYNAKNIFINARTGALVIIMGNIILGILTVIPFKIADSATGLLYLVILTVVYTIATVFIRRSLKELANCSGTNSFATVSQLLLIGSILLIIGIGALLILIATLMLSEAFFTLKKPQTTTNLNTQTNFCTQCGTPLPSDSIFCTQCGKQTQTKQTT